MKTMISYSVLLPHLQSSALCFCFKPFPLLIHSIFVICNIAFYLKSASWRLSFYR
uniref:Uncharacterized protein n=1 Tax=Rhizophora mucronata TaxID=61149 RepID=A0A2P2QUY4_RHIMU